MAHHADHERVSQKLRDHWARVLQRMADETVRALRTWKNAGRSSPTAKEVTRLLHEAGVASWWEAMLLNPTARQVGPCTRSSSFWSSPACPRPMRWPLRHCRMQESSQWRLISEASLPGRLADIVILKADPTIDVRNTRKIYAVIHDGVEVFSLEHEGLLYAIRPDGRMHWYKDENRQRQETGQGAEWLGAGCGKPGQLRLGDL